MIEISILKNFKTTFDGDFFFDSLHQKLYATDASVYRKYPLAVAFPKSVNAIQQLIHFAHQNKISLTPRAGGTSLAGQVVSEGIVVDVSKYLNSIISLDLENKTITVEPGVIRDELNAYLKPYNLFFGPNTSTSNRCTIGGMVGNNSSGTTSIKYGVTRDKVEAIEVVLSDGEVAFFSNENIESFNKVKENKNFKGTIYNKIYQLLSPSDVIENIKNEFPKPSIHRRNTGYALDALVNSEVFVPDNTQHFNLCNLLCGSEGTLAFTTKITLKLDTLPPSQSLMVATQYNELNASMKDVVIAMQHSLYTCELMDDVILNCTKNNKQYKSYRHFIKGEPKAVLLLELRANTVLQLDHQLNLLLEDLKKSGNSNTQTILRGEEIEQALELRKAGLGLLGNMVGDKKTVPCIEDTAVAIEDLPAYVEAFTEIMNNYNQPAVYYAHAGAGELHLRPILNLKKQEDVLLFKEITEAVAQLVKKYRGSFSGEHGDGIVRSGFIEMQIGTKNYEIVKSIKQLFDPYNIFNRGKIVNPWPIESNLRYQPDRVEPNTATYLNFEDTQGLLRLAEKCNGSGDCRKTEQAAGMLCPSYQATKNEKDTTRARANVLREALTTNLNKNPFNDEDLKQAFSLCVGCKACASECPSNVDMATAKVEFLYQYQQANGYSKRSKFFGLSSYQYKKASKYALLVNLLIGNKLLSQLLKKYYAIAPQRTLPQFSEETFLKKWSKNKIQPLKNYKKEVYLFVDEFSNYLEANLAEDAYVLLEQLGYKVNPITQLDSARAMISKGFLKQARQEVEKSINFLKNKITNNTPLLGIEPSAILGFRDEYLRFFPESEALKIISKNSFLIEEFLAQEIKLDNIDASYFTTDTKKIKIHVHCHQKALGTQKDTFDILNLPENYTPTIISSGCCGMAGSFGYEAENYAISMKIGETKLFPALRKVDKDLLIVANGTSCRHQIKDGVGREALHPITVLREALKIIK